MTTRIMAAVLVALSLGGGAAAAGQPPVAGKTDPKPAPTADEQVGSLEQMCEGNATARADRQAKKSLYERLGKDDGIHRLTKEVVRLHLVNPAIRHMFDGLDNDLVARHVAEFMIANLGGPQVYVDRPSLPDSHRRLKLTNADFMAAGGDVIQAMKNLGCGQDEIDEVVCALVALRPMVVLATE